MCIFLKNVFIFFINLVGLGFLCDEDCETAETSETSE